MTSRVGSRIRAAAAAVGRRRSTSRPPLTCPPGTNLSGPPGLAMTSPYLEPISERLRNETADDRLGWGADIRHSGRDRPHFYRFAIMSSCGTEPPMRPGPVTHFLLVRKHKAPPTRTIEQSRL